MIRNNVITYENFPSSFMSWRPSDETSFALLSACVTTLFCYQLTASIHDLYFGLKPRGTASLRAVSLFLLANSSSPSYVFRSIVPKSARTEKPCGSALSLLKPVVMLGTAPLISIASIALTIESVRTLSFTEAGFGGIALGVNSDFSVLPKETIFRQSAQFPIHTARADSPVVDFETEMSVVQATRGKHILLHEQDERDGVTLRDNASMRQLPGLTELADGSVVLEVMAEYGSQIVFGIRDKNNVMFATISVAGRVSLRNPEETYAQTSKHQQQSDLIKTHNQTFYYLSHAVKGEDAIKLAAIGGKRLAHWCSQRDIGRRLRTDPAWNGKRRVFLARWGVQCSKQGSLYDLHKLLFKLVEPLTLVNAPKLELLKRGEWEIIDGGSFDFLRRTTAPGSLPVMAVLLGTALLLRILVRIGTENDLHQGVGLAFRDVLSQTKCSDPRVRQIVFYEPGSQFIEVKNDGHKSLRQNNATYQERLDNGAENHPCGP